MLWIREVLTVLFLAFSSWKDWKHREISLLLTGGYGIMGFVVSICQKRTMSDWLVPVGISLLILTFSILTRGEIGMGDAWIFCALGAMLPTERFIKTVSIGMLAAAGYAGVLLVICRKSRKTEIPLIPFLLTGYLGGILL